MNDGMGSRLEFSPGGKSGLHRAGSPFEKEGYRGQYSAGRKAQQKTNRRIFPVRVKRWGKSPPGVGENRTAWHAPPAARPNRGRAVARGVTSSGFWSHRQMIAAFLEGTKSGLQYRHSPDPVPGGSGQVVFALLIFPHGG